MYRTLIRIFLLGCLLLNVLVVRAEVETATKPVVIVPVLSIDGAIGPAVSDYLLREISAINLLNQTPIIIITIDTPGGLSSSLRDINQGILSSNIPIVCLVYPQGARAASAGTYLLYACHVAAMATATTLGAATPVMIAGPSAGAKEQQPNAKPSAMENKILNDSIAYIRSLAQLRQRNEEWAELAVSQAATLTAAEALDKNVIDLMAQSPEHLLSALANPALKINQNKAALSLADAQLDYRDPDWRSQFIATITNPNIAYILMLVGVYGLLLEFYSPGVGIAGITGAISLFIGLYAFQMLPLNYAGFGLLLLGLTLMVVESMAPSFGVFGIGGLIAFILGSIFLIDTELQQFQIAIELIVAIALVSALFIVLLLGMLWRSRHNAVVSGTEEIVGALAQVTDEFNQQGYVLLNGERWAACCDEPLQPGQIVVVTAIDGLRLQVSQRLASSNKMSAGD
ncbi:MAG: nodulation protein NfeD [Gammaproteobacteria bacterium]|nr:nodulation protein NfeD [Gammaproteobacteria bacterium]